MAVRSHFFVMLCVAVKASLAAAAIKEQPIPLPDCTDGAVVTLEPRRYIRDNSTQMLGCTMIGQPGTLIQGDPGLIAGNTSVTLKGVITFDGLGKSARFHSTNVNGDNISFVNMELITNGWFIVGGGRADFHNVNISCVDYSYFGVVDAEVRFQDSTYSSSEFSIQKSKVSAIRSHMFFSHGSLTMSYSTLLFDSTTINVWHGSIGISGSRVNFTDSSISAHSGVLLNLDSCNAYFMNTSLKGLNPDGPWTPKRISIKSSDVTFYPDCSSFDNATVHSSDMHCGPGLIAVGSSEAAALATVVV